MNINQLPQFDPLIYNNRILTDNILILSSSLQQNYHLYNLQFENQQLNNKIIELEKQLNDSKLAIKSYITVTQNYMNKEKLEKEKKEKYTNNLHYVIMHKPKFYSWSDKKINNIIASIKSIDCIIKLKEHFHNIKHNITLAKLCNIIPPLIKLRDMIGLSKIKQDVFKKIIYHIMNPEEKCDYLHTIISGPPGVGKTEFAKIYADIFVHMGILKKNTFVEIKRNDLVGQFLGHTAQKTRELLDRAIGGVLFLDEAYSLGNMEKRDSFSKEAIDMINVYLSEKKGEFMFIIAGYEEDLETCFFAFNQGLKRRFHSHYMIAGYEPKEMKEIFINKVSKTKFKINIMDNMLLKFFTNNIKVFAYYGGDIEKLFNEVKQCQSLRTFNTNTLSKDIIMDDIINGLAIFAEKKKDDVPHGMYL